MHKPRKTILIAGLAAILATAPALAQTAPAPSGVLNLRLLLDVAPSANAQLVFVDQKSKKQVGPKITVWQLTLYATPRPAEDGKKVAGVWSQVTIDCLAKTIQGGDGVVLSDKLDVLATGNSGEASRAVRPNTIDARNMSLACDDKDPYPGNPSVADVATARGIALAHAVPAAAPAAR
ncbi:MAG: surface-adhesin E family protein [Alphaproteobacteria bacterium]